MIPYRILRRCKLRQHLRRRSTLHLPVGIGIHKICTPRTVRTSGFPVDYRVDTPAELARAFKIQNELKLGGGMLVTNPIPEEYSMPVDVINSAIEKALAECSEKGIKGKATTPFLLARVAEITGGDSLASNIRLVYNNAALAAKTALEYSRL